MAAGNRMTARQSPAKRAIGASRCTTVIGPLCQVIALLYRTFVPVQLLTNAPNLGLPEWKVLPHHVPGHLEINAEVFVDQDVSRRGDVAPGNGGVPRPNIIRNALHRLADDLQAAYHGVLLFDIRGKLLEVQTIRAVSKQVAGIENLTKKDGDASAHRTGTSSLRIRSRRFGWSEPRVATSTSRPRISQRSNRSPERSTSVRPFSKSTRKSKSLLAVASPRATEPKMPTRTTPRRDIGSATFRRISSMVGLIP